MRRILIENGEVDVKDCVYGFPWKYDATCFNFKAPNEIVQASEIEKIDYWDEITTLVIGCDLDDYSFIANMVNLYQLYIYTGHNIKNISFIKGLINLSHLYIDDSCVESLDDLKKLIVEKKRLFDEETNIYKRLSMGMDAICINSKYSLDGQELWEPGTFISELIINRKRVKKLR